MVTILICKVVSLQAQLMQVKAQLAQTLMATGNQSWPSYTAGGGGAGVFPAAVNSAGSPQSSMDSFEGYSEGLGFVKQEVAMVQNRDNNEDNYCYYGGNNSGSCNRKRVSQTDLGELQALALRMMRN